MNREAMIESARKLYANTPHPNREFIFGLVADFALSDEVRDIHVAAERQRVREAIEELGGLVWNNECESSEWQDHFNAGYDLALNKLKAKLDAEGER